MPKIPFSEEEMNPVEIQKGFPGCPDRAIWKIPVSNKENDRAAIYDKQAYFVADVLDVKMYEPRIMPDNRARGTVIDSGGMFVPSAEGELDAFGITWLYDPVINGSMVKPGNPLLDDVEEWKDVITIPNVEDWDWNSQFEMDKDYFQDTDKYDYVTTIFTGFFERLISWMDFEEAAVAMIDDDCQPFVKEIFSALADYYISYIEKLKNQFDGISALEIHDDWGSQKAPFMSEETLREMIFPYIKRVVDYAHGRGMWVRLHSCGRIESLVPMMIDLGVDAWMGQDINDKAKVVAEYGDKLVVECEVPELGEDATDEEVWSSVEKWADDFIIPGKPISLSVYSAARSNRPLVTEAVYKISRQRYSA